MSIVTFTKKQLLNITTGKLHTCMEDIYSFFEQVFSKGVMTHNLPNCQKAFKPFISKIPELASLPQEGYHPNFSEEQVTFSWSESDRAEAWDNYSKLPNPFLTNKN